MTDTPSVTSHLPTQPMHTRVAAHLADCWPAWALALVVLVADQASKAALVPWLLAEGPQRITGWFNLVMVWNRGISFGLLGGDDQELRRWLLIGMTGAITLGLVWWLVTGAHTARQRLAIGAVIGGAVGNILDRVRYGAVADFFDVHVAGYHWPAFNIADAAITLGALTLALTFYFAPPGDEATRDEPTRDADPQERTHAP